jgi:hypothetical protein
MVFKCLENNNYQHEKCIAYFENYNCCKTFWVCISALYVLVITCKSPFLNSQYKSKYMTTEWNLFGSREKSVQREDGKVKCPTCLHLRNVKRLELNMWQVRSLQNLSDLLSFISKNSTNIMQWNLTVILDLIKPTNSQQILINIIVVHWKMFTGHNLIYLQLYFLNN